jgi:hypothetical protein
MSHTKLALLSALATVVLWTGIGAAAAYDGPYYAGGCAAGWLYPGRSIYVTESIPYFALNPPVYYSYPVPRTFGYSPFAYPPGVLTPDSRQREPLVVRNQYTPNAFANGGEGQTEKKPPLIVKNPYVE